MNKYIAVGGFIFILFLSGNLLAAEHPNWLAAGAGLYHTDGYETMPAFLFSYRRNLSGSLGFSGLAGYSTLSLSHSNRQIDENFSFRFQQEKSPELFLDLDLFYILLENKKSTLCAEAGFGMLRAGSFTYLTGNFGLHYNRQLFSWFGLFVQSRMHLYRSDLFHIIAESGSAKEGNAFFAQNFLFNGGVYVNF